MISARWRYTLPLTLMVAAIPATMVFTNESPSGRYVFAACMLAILGLGSFVAIDLFTHPGQELGKGASGAAVQNLNLMIGAEETLGVDLPQSA